MLIVGRSGLGVLQQLVSLVDLLESLLGLRVIGIAIWVKLLRQPDVGAPYVITIRAGNDTKDIVSAVHSYGPLAIALSDSFYVVPPAPDRSINRELSARVFARPRMRGWAGRTQ
jgi:hypothetical protein